MNTQAAKKLWNHMAANFAKMEIPSVKDNFTMKLISQYKLCPQGSRALDVGCGAGRYAIALAKMGVAVEATDFSEEMIGQAKQCAQDHGAGDILFFQDDWSKFDIKDRAWDQKFDLVLCNMTPAVHDRATLEKAIAASKGWLLITKHRHRTNSVLDRLHESLGLEARSTKSEDQIKMAFDYLWDQQYSPEMVKEEQVWNHQRPLEEAIKHYSLFIESQHGIDLTPDQKDKLQAYLEKVSQAGIVEETTHVTIYALVCKIR